MQKAIEFLLSPYPVGVQSSFRDGLKSSLLFTAFIILINVLGDLTFENLDVTLLFSFGMFVVLLFNLTIIPRIFPAVFRESKWKVWKETMWIAYQFICIATGNFLFFIWFDLVETDWNVYRTFLGTTLGVGIGPVLVFLFYDQNRLLKRNLIEAKNINNYLAMPHENSSMDEPIIFTSKSTHTTVKVNRYDLLLLEAFDNYVKILFNTDHEHQAEIFRVTLTELEQQLMNYPEFIRCHRAYIVNLNQIKEVTGNAQGLKLRIRNLNKPIPVSRKYITRFKAYMVSSS